MSECSPQVCKECPFRRVSPRGWLGEASFPEPDPHGFMAPHYHGGLWLPCHKRVNWSREDAQVQAERAPLCRGFAIFLKNSVKWPETERMERAIEDIEPDHKAIFSWPHEFVEHHHGSRRAS